jgi:hypothetical protein
MDPHSDFTTFAHARRRPRRRVVQEGNKMITRHLEESHVAFDSQLEDKFCLLEYKVSDNVKNFCGARKLITASIAVYT